MLFANAIVGQPAPSRKDGLRPLSTRAGIVTYQSAAMTQSRAEAFARCLNANGRYAGASVHETKPGSRRFTVAFLPSSPEAQEGVFARYQQEQIDRAIAEVDGYKFSLLPSGTCNVTTLPNETGKRKGERDTYVVSHDLTSCDCPHFVHRLKAAGALCKHICAVAAYRDHLAKVQAETEDACEACGELVPASTLETRDGFLVCDRCAPFLTPIPDMSVAPTPRTRAEKIALDFD